MLFFMSELYLIRHGQASFGSENYDQLSELGIRQSKLLAEHLQLVGFLPDAIYSGPLERHKSTAALMYEVFCSHGIGLAELKIVEEFREYNAKAIVMAFLERNPGFFSDSGAVHDQSGVFWRMFRKAMLAWVEGALDSSVPETWEDLKSRVASAIKRMMSIHEGRKTVAVFTSGGAISASLAISLNLSGAAAMNLNWQIANASVTRYSFDKKKFVLSGFNSIAHLRLHRDSSLITWW